MDIRPISATLLMFVVVALMLTAKWELACIVLWLIVIIKHAELIWPYSVSKTEELSILDSPEKE